MKFTEIKCPNCGANLELDREPLKAECPYCGTRLIIEPDDADIVQNPDKKQLKTKAKEEKKRAKQQAKNEKKNRL
ncbi:MAG: zinc-ribbon domain-containing protein [Anaerolineaceae bacterium]|nr:zinc-ribbon domain-containing protein [Anaerolineaceae bacterium]